MRGLRARRLHLELVRSVVLVAVISVVAERAADGHAVGDPDGVDAATVVDVLIEPSGLRMEIETGVPDLVVFADLFPDDFRVRMGLEPEPEGPRLRRFLADRLVVRADGGAPLPGRVVSFETRRRLSRRGPAGESVAVMDSPGEPVAVVVLSFPFRKRPDRIEIRGPVGNGAARSPTIDLVAFHLGVPVTDQVAFDGDIALDLDWADPWRSEVRDSRLRRSFDGPLAVFLYLEADQLRVEVIARPVDLQAWSDLGVEGLASFPEAIQDEVASRAAAFLGDHLGLAVDGEPVRPALDRVDFRERTRRPSTVIDPPRELDAVSATVAALFSHPLSDEPGEATLTWELFPEGIDRVPAAVVDGAETRRSILRPRAAVLRWSGRSEGDGWLSPLEVPPVPTAVDAAARWTSWLALAVVGAALLRAVARAAGSDAGWGQVCLIGTVALAFVAAVRITTEAATVDDERVAEVASALLGNVYRACDLRDEASAARELTHSVAGDSLGARILGQVRQSELAGVDGARARVRAVELLAAEVVDTTGSVTARCAWTVTSEAGHWGHLHRWVEGHAAELGLEPVNGVWKIVSLEDIDTRAR